MKKLKWASLALLSLAVTLLWETTTLISAAKSDQPELRFSVISDIHVGKWSKKSQKKLTQALTDIHAAMPDSQALVVNGDLGNGFPEDYETLGNIMKAIDLPKNVFYTIGNHEYYKAWYDKYGAWNANRFPNNETVQASQARFLNFTRKTSLYDDAWVSGYHFVFLGSEAYRQNDPNNKEDAWLSDSQLNWLETTLKEEEQPLKPIFVFLHQPLPNTVAGSQTYLHQRGVVQADRLRAILIQHPQVVFFSGHTHRELKSDHTLVTDTFTMVNSSSVYAPYDETNTAFDQKDQRSEGLDVEVFAEKVLIQGRDFTHQAWIPKARFEIKPGVSAN
jgi:Icc protein